LHWALQAGQKYDGCVRLFSVRDARRDGRNVISLFGFTTVSFLVISLPSSSSAWFRNLPSEEAILLFVTTFLDKVVVERLLRAIVPGDDTDDAEVDVREVRSRGSACTCVFIARSIKLCPGRSIF
jgi:hypothetical protein